MNARPQAPCPQAASAATQRRSSLACCILLVDDHNDTLRASAAALVRCGYEVDTAEDGESAWKAIQAHNYDLLITDNIMPKLTGVELVKKLRSAKINLPVILASGLIVIGVESFYQQIVIGLILILAVYIDQERRSRRESL